MHEQATPPPERPLPAAGAGLRIDVRQQLAADRTLLAWIRTSIAVAALGFVVARFNLVLRSIQHVSATKSAVARGIGIGLVAAGAVLLAIGMMQHRSVLAALKRDGDPLDASRWQAVTAAAVAMLGIVAVCIYLATGVS